ncbi:MAG: tRNA cytosine(34) acetyltransferase TmcA [Gammaproteobacteria bacterium]|nr:MAG: tRNA cytosine(34) acetyltransferase TmcA [Gammaproteobacteria bacterium]
MKQRQCLILKGDTDWCRLSLSILLEEFDKERVICLSSETLDNISTIPPKKAQNQLGKEFDLVIFDATDLIAPDSLGAIIGTITAGGTLILLLSESENPSLWMQRFFKIFTKFCHHYDSFKIVHQGQSLPEIFSPISRSSTDSLYLTDNQQQAVAAILNVVHGHRRRPLVLSSDRGRGKSAALGLAAAQLLTEGKQTILLTAPSLAVTETVFEHASRLLPQATLSRALISIGDAEIRFIAPDILVESEQKADLLMIDEAAAIPASMLEKLLQKYSRIVFATTLHGYEGTGQGFTVRFQQLLDRHTPNWHSYQMETPIRWIENDQLEAFSFQALLLDAVPAEDELISDAQVDSVNFELIDRQQLVNDEQSLRELFGLMVLAHYRTRPSDLQMMLDREDINVYAMRYQGHIIASAWLVKEGGLGDDLANAIYAGERRLKGHLLPQSLLAHAGIANAGSISYQRIIRIAVHPAVQQRGLGKAMLKQIVSLQSKSDTDLIGTSFGANKDLLAFWNQSGFTPVRLGIHQDNVSGNHAVMLLRQTSSAGQKVLNDASLRLQQQWPHLLHTSFEDIDPELVITLSQLIPQQQLQLSHWNQQDIQAFCYAQRGYEFSHVALWHLITVKISGSTYLELTSEQQNLCVMVVLQQREWSDIAKRLKYTGKAEIIAALRESIKLLLIE